MIEWRRNITSVLVDFYDSALMNSLKSIFHKQFPVGSTQMQHHVVVISATKEVIVL